MTVSRVQSVADSSLKSEKDLDHKSPGSQGQGAGAPARILQVSVEARPVAVNCILPCLCEAPVGTVVSPGEVSQAYCKYCERDTESEGSSYVQTEAET